MFIDNVLVPIATIWGFVNFFMPFTSFLSNGSAKDVGLGRVHLCFLSCFGHHFGNRRTPQHVPVFQVGQPWATGAMLEEIAFGAFIQITKSDFSKSFECGRFFPDLPERLSENVAAEDLQLIAGVYIAFRIDRAAVEHSIAWNAIWIFTEVDRFGALSSHIGVRQHCL